MIRELFQNLEWFYFYYCLLIFKYHVFFYFFMSINKINYTDNGLLLHDRIGIVDYSIGMKTVIRDNVKYNIIVNLHENMVLVVEHYDKVNKDSSGNTISVSKDRKKIYYKKKIYNQIIFMIE